MHFRFGVEIDSNWDFMNGLLPRVRETFDFLRFNWFSSFSRSFTIARERTILEIFLNITYCSNKKKHKKRSYYNSYEDAARNQYLSYGTTNQTHTHCRFYIYYFPAVFNSSKYLHEVVRNRHQIGRQNTRFYKKYIFLLIFNLISILPHMCGHSFRCSTPSYSYSSLSL